MQIDQLGSYMKHSGLSPRVSEQRSTMDEDASGRIGVDAIANAELRRSDQVAKIAEIEKIAATSNNQFRESFENLTKQLTVEESYLEF